MADKNNNPLLEKLFAELVQKVENNLKFAVEREGLVDTKELHDSIRAGKVQVGEKEISASVVYSALLRIKDMKKISYFTIPPLRPLVEWVERTGVSKFAYVPGYPNSVAKTSEIDQIYRIAKAVQYNLKARPNVIRGYRGIYNEQLYKKIIPAFANDLMAASAIWAMQNIEESFGFHSFVPTPSEGINDTRMMAAWNARDTKLDRKEGQ